METETSYMLYTGIIAGFTAGAVFRKPIKRLAIKAMSKGVDVWYDMKYSYFVDLPEISQELKSESEKARERAKVIKVHDLDHYLIYQWIDGKYYITTDAVPPYLPDTGETDIFSDDLITSSEAILFFNDDTNRPATAKEMNGLNSLAGPGQDFSLCSKPSLAAIQKVLSLLGLTKVIYNNYNYEEFIFR